MCLITLHSPCNLVAYHMPHMGSSTSSAGFLYHTVPPLLLPLALLLLLQLLLCLP